MAFCRQNLISVNRFHVVFHIMAQMVFSVNPLLFSALLRAVPITLFFVKFRQIFHILSRNSSELKKTVLLSVYARPQNLTKNPPLCHPISKSQRPQLSLKGRILPFRDSYAFAESPPHLLEKSFILRHFGNRLPVRTYIPENSPGIMGSVKQGIPPPRIIDYKILSGKAIGKMVA